MAKNFLGGENTCSVTQCYCTVVVLVLWFLDSKPRGSNRIWNQCILFLVFYIIWPGVFFFQIIWGFDDTFDGIALKSLCILFINSLYASSV